MKDPALAGDQAVDRFLSLQADKLHASQATAKRADARAARNDPADKGLSLADLQQDEATRQPANARATRRATQRVHRRLLKRARKIQAQRLLLQRRYTPAPSRGASRLAERLLAEHGAVTYTEQEAA